MSYYLGDIPAVNPEFDVPLDVDLSHYTSATATLYDSTGVAVLESSAPVLDAEAGTVQVFYSGETVFETEGVYRWRIVLFGEVDTIQLADEEVVVEDAANGWHTLSSARAEWTSNLPDVQLYNLLEIARVQCEAYAPALAEGTPVPARYRMAQLLQARDSLNAARVNPNGGYDDGSYALTPFPMTWKVKALLRPQRGVPVMG